jgi:hypothetical protein
VVFLQPVVVTALKVKDARVSYRVGSFDAGRQHRPILATLVAEVTWAYLPSQSDAQRLGIKLHPPREELTAVVTVPSRPGKPLLVASGKSESGSSLLFTFSFDAEWLVEALDWRLTPARLEAWWLGAYGQPLGPVEQQQAMDLYIVPAMAYPLEWREGDGFTLRAQLLAWLNRSTPLDMPVGYVNAWVEFYNIVGGQPLTQYNGVLYGPYGSSGTEVSVNVNLQGSKGLAVGMYVVPMDYSLAGKRYAWGNLPALIVPAPAVYPPRP